jgi:hypothetical protein
MKNNLSIRHQAKLRLLCGAPDAWLFSRSLACGLSLLALAGRIEGADLRDKFFFTPTSESLSFKIRPSKAPTRNSGVGR